MSEKPECLSPLEVALNERDELRVRCGELARMLAEADALHLADEQSLRNMNLQIREKDDWIKALETRVDTQTKMLAALGLTELRDHPDYVEKRKDETGHWCVRSQDTPCPQCGATQ